MAERPQMTLHRLNRMHAEGEKIAMLTCYDAAFARLLDESGVDVLLVGDSLGMVIQGRGTTLTVSMADMLYHTRCVAGGNRTAWVIADLPFGSYQESPAQAVQNAVALIQAGAHMVKLEGGGWTAAAVRLMVERGIPVCAHLGFTPQSVHALGGYRIQGREESGAAILHAHARELEAAGAQMLILELVPSEVARTLTAGLSIPVVGIGAGSGCSGQVLVLHDMLDITRGKLPRFVRNFMQESSGVEDAIRRFVTDVKSGAFPDDARHGY
ncbi:MAG: 3-methyl-2-oxobutanoate hydroxymethyltransferase [Steroidobacteraceae bacterium]